MSNGMALALAGERIIKDKIQAHRTAIAERGYGTHYGDHSEYVPPAGSALTQSSCIGWAMECAGAAFAAAGQGAMWSAIRRNVRARGMRGVDLVQQLVTNVNWPGIYWNPDTLKPDDGDSEHPYSYEIARSRKTYYNVRVVDYVINYRPSDRSRTTKDLTGLNKLEKVPFWVGCARGGVHVFCGSRGVVAEFHWNAPATDPDAIETVRLDEYTWLSGIICVPPGLWPAASR